MTGDGRDEGPSSEDLYEHAPCGYLSTTPDGTVTRVNQTLLRWTGRDRAEVEGRPLADLLTPGAVMFYETHYRAVLQMRGRVDGVALDLARKDGTALPVLVTAERHPGEDGRDARVHVTLFGTSGRSAYEQELRRTRQVAERSEARMRLLHDVREACRSVLEPGDVAAALVTALGAATRGGVVTVWFADAAGALALQAGAPGPASPAVLAPHAAQPAALALRHGRPLGLRQDELRRDWPDVAAALSSAGREALLVAPLVADDAVVGVVQIALRRDRVVPPEELAVLAEVGREAGQALLRCELPAHLRGLPLRDAVTGTATPALFGERVDAALLRAADSDKPVAVLLLDVAVAQDSNEPPPPVGDEVMAELGRRLRRLTGPAAAARVGRQRFAVLSERCDVATAAGYADRLQAELTDPPPPGPPLSVTVGAAVAEPAAGESSVSVSGLLGWASRALDDATTRGPGRRVVHGSASRQAARALVDAERTVRRALREDDVVLHYQPVVHLRTGRVVGVEALCRLRRGDGTLLPPAGFIDAAEDSGLIVPLGRRTLVLACGQQAAWAAAGTALDIAVNVAATQAGQPGFAQEVLDVLAETGCPARKLVLELTESALLSATPAALRSFRLLREAGVRVALDDFGTRYASLDYVRSFPLDELKIDQSFVAGLPHSRVAAAIVRMVAQLAGELDLACVAEGIETVEQAVFLRELGVLGQGFALGHPVPAEQLVTWVMPPAWLAASRSFQADPPTPCA